MTHRKEKLLRIGGSYYRVEYGEAYDAVMPGRVSHIRCPYCFKIMSKKNRRLRYLECPQCKRLYKMRGREQFIIEVEITKITESEYNDRTEAVS